MDCNASRVRRLCQPNPGNSQSERCVCMCNKSMKSVGYLSGCDLILWDQRGHEIKDVKGTYIYDVLVTYYIHCVHTHSLYILARNGTRHISTHSPTENGLKTLNRLRALTVRGFFTSGSTPALWKGLLKSTTRCRMLDMVRSAAATSAPMTGSRGCPSDWYFWFVTITVYSGLFKLYMYMTTSIRNKTVHQQVHQTHNTVLPCEICIMLPLCGGVPGSFRSIRRFYPGFHICRPVTRTTRTGAWTSWR